MSTISLELNPHDRLQLSTTIENLINMLDALDPDPDLECGADPEPWLGWPEGGPSRLAKGMRHDDDREADLGGTVGYDEHGRLQYELEDDTSDAEPYLGAHENHPSPHGGAYCGQTAWANSAVFGDLECNLADASTDVEHCDGDYDGPGLIAGGQGL